MQLNLQGSNHVAFLSDAFSLAQDLLGEILVGIKGISDFSEGTETSRNRQITVLTEDISRFVEITTLLSRVVSSNDKVLLESVKQSHIHLLFVIKALHQASKKQDLVALEELIKYELKDNLTQWKIDLIPQTKRLLLS